MVLGTAHVYAKSAKKLVDEGNALYAERKLDEAQSKYDEALEKKPDSPQVKYNKANTAFCYSSVECLGNIPDTILS